MPWAKPRIFPDVSLLTRTCEEEQHLKVHMETYTSQFRIKFYKYTEAFD